MTGYLTRDRISILAALAAPLAVAAVLLLPIRASWSDTNVQARLVAVTLADQAGRAFGATQIARSVP